MQVECKWCGNLVKTTSSTSFTYPQPNGIFSQESQNVFKSGFEPLTQGFLVLCSNHLSYLNKNQKELCTILVYWLFKKY